MAIGSLFKSGSKNLIAKISAKDFSSPKEKTAAYEELAKSDKVKPAEAIPFLFSPDAALRKAVGKMLARRKDPDTIRQVLVASNGRAEGARRAAMAVLSEVKLGVGLGTQLGQSRR